MEDSEDVEGNEHAYSPPPFTSWYSPPPWSNSQNLTEQIFKALIESHKEQIDLLKKAHARELDYLSKEYVMAIQSQNQNRQK